MFDIRYCISSILHFTWNNNLIFAYMQLSQLKLCNINSNVYVNNCLAGIWTDCLICYHSIKYYARNSYQIIICLSRHERYKK